MMDTETNNSEEIIIEEKDNSSEVRKEEKEKKEKSLISKLIMDFIAGVAVGAGAILPGFSGGVLCVVLGMFAGGALAAWIAKREGWSKEIIWDFFFYGVFFGVLGARIYYVIFSWEY